MSYKAYNVVFLFVCTYTNQPKPTHINPLDQQMLYEIPSIILARILLGFEIHIIKKMERREANEKI